VSRPPRPPFEFAGTFTPAGHAAVVDLPVPPLVTGARISLPVRIFHGRRDGPVVWVSAAIHGDEIGGVEVVRRVSARLKPRQLHGTVLSVPIVNVHGFLNGDRYLPDRRDLNRSFPGSTKGSLASRVASAFMREIVARSNVGIDLHTGSDHRSNLPQLRGDFDDPRTRELALAFGAPLMLHSGLRDGSLRAAATEAGVTVLLYEGGEAWRFDEDAIAVATRGTLRVLAKLGMIDEEVDPASDEPLEARASRWVRARRSGIALVSVTLGERVTRGQRIAIIHDSLGRTLSRASAPSDGVVIGLTQHPLVHQGDALVHVATIESEDVE
jgi:predicted deacylase